MLRNKAGIDDDRDKRRGAERDPCNDPPLQRQDKRLTAFERDPDAAERRRSCRCKPFSNAIISTIINIFFVQHIC